MQRYSLEYEQDQCIKATNDCKNVLLRNYSHPHY